VSEGGCKSCVTLGRTKITQVVNCETKQLHCVTTTKRTITLCDNTKPNNYIVWQHQTKQLHCVTISNQAIALYDNTKPNNYIVWQHVRTWNYDKRILPKIMCPQQEEKVVWGGGWKSCVGKKLCHSRTNKNYTSCKLWTQTITLHDNTKPNNYIVWQHQIEQLHCMITPNRTITLCDNTKPNNYIVWQHVRTWYYDKRILPKICNYWNKQLHCMTTSKNIFCNY